MEDEVRTRLQTEFADDDGLQIEVAVDGNRATISIVSEGFAGMSRVKRQQRVYGCIEDLIQSGALHAVTIQASSPDES